jgi:hypothetical protein
LAAFLVALPFFFPAYYTTWGRMTQLAGVLVLPVLLAFTWLLVRGGRQWRKTWSLVAIVAAGLFLIHFRVFLFFIPFVAIVWLVSLGRNTRLLAASAGVALLLSIPRIVQLVTMTESTANLRNTIPNYNAFPMSYVTVGWERLFIGFAAFGLLIVMVAGLMRRRWSLLPLTLAGWVGLLFFFLAGQRIGLPETWLVNLNSMYITLFLPLSIFLAVVFHQMWRWLRRSHWLARAFGEVASGGVLTLLLLFGIRQQITILNPQTILAKWEDLVALDWANENLPDDASIAVSAWQWQGNIWAGTDGGAWLLPLTGRFSTTPPVDYIFDASLRESVGAFNVAAEAQTDWASTEAAEWLQQQGVSYVYVGARGGFFDPASLARNPALQKVYGRDGVFIFAVEP